MRRANFLAALVLGLVCWPAQADAQKVLYNGYPDADVRVTKSSTQGFCQARFLASHPRLGSLATYVRYWPKTGDVLVRFTNDKIAAPPDVRLVSTAIHFDYPDGKHGTSPVATFEYELSKEYESDAPIYAFEAQFPGGAAAKAVLDGFGSAKFAALYHDKNLVGGARLGNSAEAIAKLVECKG